jgi:AcrR family transcriptional regulator
VSIYDLDQYFKWVFVTIEPLTPERRRAMTRRHLLDAAAVVFARNGFHGASLDEVATMAGFTKGAVYSNFKSKDDLFLALLDDRLEREADAMRLELANRDSRPPGEQFSSILDLIERYSDDDWTALALEFVLYARRNPEARAKLTASARRQHAATRGMLEQEYERVGARPEFSTEVLATISTALFEGLGIGRLVDPSTYTESMMREVLAFLYATIGVDGVTPPS